MASSVFCVDSSVRTVWSEYSSAILRNNSFNKHSGGKVSLALFSVGQAAFQVSKSIWTTDLWQLLCLSVITIRSRCVKKKKNICWQCVKHKINQNGCKSCSKLPYRIVTHFSICLGGSNEINPVYLCISVSKGCRYTLCSLRELAV